MDQVISNAKTADGLNVDVGHVDVNMMDGISEKYFKYK